MLGYEQGSRVRGHHYADSLHGDDTKKPELLIQFWLSVNVTRYGVNRFMDADGGGAIVMTALAVESWIRVAHIIPLHDEVRTLQKQLNRLQAELRNLEEE